MIIKWTFAYMIINARKRVLFWTFLWYWIAEGPNLTLFYGPFYNRGSKLEQRFMLKRWTFMIILREKVLFMDLFMILNSIGSKLEQHFMLVRWTFRILSREKGLFLDLFMILNSRSAEGTSLDPFFWNFLWYNLDPLFWTFLWYWIAMGPNLNSASC